MNKAVIYVLTWVHGFLFTVGIFPFCNVFHEQAQGGTQLFLLESLWFLLPVIAGDLLIRKETKLWKFAAGALAVNLFGAGGVLLTSRNHAVAFSIIYLLVAFFFMGVRLGARVKKGRERQELRSKEQTKEKRIYLEEGANFLNHPTPFGWAFYGVFYVAALLVQSYLVIKVLFACILVDVFVCFLYGYFTRLEEFIYGHQEVADFSTASMKKVGTFLGGAACVLLLLFVLPSVLYGKEPLMEVFAHLSQEQEPLLEEEVFFQEETEQFSMGEMGDWELQGGDTFVMPKWVEDVWKWLLYACMAAAGVFLLYAVYRSIKNTEEEFREIEEEVVFLEKKVSEEGSFRKRTSLFAKEHLSLNKKIRKQYKKSIKKRLKKQSLGGWESPKEIEKKAGVENETLHRIYEKARYSPFDCTEEELEEVHKSF